VVTHLSLSSLGLAPAPHVEACRSYRRSRCWVSSCAACPEEKAELPICLSFRDSAEPWQLSGRRSGADQSGRRLETKRASLRGHCRGRPECLRAAMARLLRGMLWSVIRHQAVCRCMGAGRGEDGVDRWGSRVDGIRTRLLQRIPASARSRRSRRRRLLIPALLLRLLLLLPLRHGRRLALSFSNKLGSNLATSLALMHLRAQSTNLPSHHPTLFCCTIRSFIRANSRSAFTIPDGAIVPAARQEPFQLAVHTFAGDATNSKIWKGAKVQRATSQHKNLHLPPIPPAACSAAQPGSSTALRRTSV
jgi:hypothetical protein